MNDTLELKGGPCGAEKASKVHKPGKKKKGYRCGNSNHATNDFYCKDTKCNNCIELGHVYRKCRLACQ